MWTARLREAIRTKDRWNVAITYTNGTVSVTRGYPLFSVTDDSLKALARAEVANCEAAEAAAITLTAGADIDLTPPTVEPPPTPTAAELAREAWFDDFRTLRRYRTLADLGLVSATMPVILTLQARLKADWLPAYLDGVY